jgi:hypothetical protein
VADRVTHVVELSTPKATLEHRVRSVIANTLNGLIAMEAEDLVNNTLELSEAVVDLLDHWDEQEESRG